MDKIFSVVTDTLLSSYDFNNVNNFLEKNPDYYVKSITPVRQPSQNLRGCYGVVIVLSNQESHNFFSGLYSRDEQELGELTVS